MFILAKRNIIIPSPETGMKPVVLKKDGFATVPDWAAETAYFKALCADGKIVATETAFSIEKNFFGLQPQIKALVINGSLYRGSRGAAP